MTRCFFATDIHGHIDRYEKLFRLIAREEPDILLLGGDILPTALSSLSSLDLKHQDFINGYLAVKFRRLREEMGDSYPQIFLILGNDDGRSVEASVLDIATSGMWTYIHDRRITFEDYAVYGYSYIPPSPIQLKDWERYDVSRYVDPGCVSPEEGYRTLPVTDHEKRYSTIQSDLESLAGDDDLSHAIFLFHTPPYQTKLDRAALDGKMIDYVPLDVHIGSIAVRRFIEKRQPLVTLHGHVHESARITGAWRDQLGRTQMFSAAHGGPELAVVQFELEEPEKADRLLL